MVRRAYEEELASILSDLKPPGPTTQEDPTEVVETVDPLVETQKVSPGPTLGGVTVKNFLFHPDTHPLILNLAMLRKYGPEALVWDVAVLEAYMPKDFGASSISHVNLHKLEACRAAHLSDAAWEEWHVFGWTTMALNGIPPDFEVLQIPTTAQCLVSLDILQRIRRDLHPSQEVQTYLRKVLRFEDIYLALPPAEYLPLDGCDFVDPKKLAELWPAVRVSGKAPTGDTVEAEQLRRLLTIHTYLEESRSKLRSQLGILSHVS